MFRRRWVAGYERVCRPPGTDTLSEIFTEDVSYVPSPWSEPIVGVAVDGQTAVVGVAVDGRCAEFEEWPFAPDQRAGH